MEYDKINNFKQNHFPYNDIPDFLLRQGYQVIVGSHYKMRYNTPEKLIKAIYDKR